MSDNNRSNTDIDFVVLPNDREFLDRLQADHIRSMQRTFLGFSYIKLFFVLCGAGIFLFTVFKSYQYYEMQMALRATEKAIADLARQAKQQQIQKILSRPSRSQPQKIKVIYRAPKPVPEEIYKDSDGVWRNRPARSVSISDLHQVATDAYTGAVYGFTDFMLENTSWKDADIKAKMLHQQEYDRERIKEIEKMLYRPLGPIDSYERVDVKREGEK